MDIENALNNVLKSQAQDAVEEYKKYLTDLIGSVSYEIPPAAVLGDTASISVASTLNAYSHTEDVKVGSHQVKEAGFWGGVKRFFTFGHAGYVTVNDYEKREFVDFSEFIRKEIISEIIKSTKSAEDLAFNWALDEERKFKTFFKTQLEKLDEAIAQKVSEQKKNLESKGAFEEMIEKNKKNLSWLNNFKHDLDSLLAI